MRKMVKWLRRARKPLTYYDTAQPKRVQVFLPPARILILSFLTIISVGTIFLMLPKATVGGTLSLIDALFTSTSATCVTGLIVVDTGTKFTTFGQVVILVLIQIGGLGIMTLSTFFIYLVAGRFSITERDIVQDTISQQPMAELARLLRSVFLVTISIEFAGWILLTLSFLRNYSATKAMYIALFHSISAFCNAGFSLFSDSFEAYRGDIFLNVVLAGLIVLGGLGFIVIYDLFKNRGSLAPWKLSNLTYHTRIVLFMTSTLIFLGALIFFALEYKNSLKNTPLMTQVVAAFFQSITARTAGFNTIRIHSLANSSLFLLIILMFIGASPGSCGGGIKTSTFAIITASVWARFRMQEEVNIFYRRIPNAVVSRAISVVFFSTLVAVFFTMVILITELQGIPHPESRGMFLEYLFEVVSAFGTVGLSTGVTPELSPLGKILIIIVMFIGRLGPLTVALAVKGRETQPKFKYVQENVMVG